MKITFCCIGRSTKPGSEGKRIWIGVQQSVRAACRTLKCGRRLPAGYLRDAEEDEKLRIYNAKMAKRPKTTAAAPVKRSFWRRLIGAK